ncbi:hypothetical protein ACFLTH_11080 [Bacteroidota bacterium]
MALTGKEMQEEHIHKMMQEELVKRERETEEIKAKKAKFLENKKNILSRQDGHKGSAIRALIILVVIILIMYGIWKVFF